MKKIRGEGGGRTINRGVACLGHSTIDHASRSTEEGRGDGEAYSIFVGGLTRSF